MSEIYWNGAPDGVIYYGHIGPNKHAVWASDDWYQYAGSDGRRFDFDDVGLDHYAREQLVITHRKPTTWSGLEDGLPPVGAVCECSHLDNDQGLVEVKYSGEFMVLWNINGNHEQCAPANEYSFRVPKQSPEQIAADEREKACMELYEVISGPGDMHAVARRAYDAGYRKQPSV